MKPFLLVSTRPEEEALVSEYQAYLHASGLNEDQLELAEFDLIGLPPIDPGLYQGVFVAGSPYGNGGTDGHVSKTQQWIADELRVFFSQIIDAGTPLLVTGTAMTILNSVLGGTNTDAYAEPPQVIDVTVTREGREDPLIADLAEDFLAYVNHIDACDELPEGAVRLGWSINCPAQVVRYGQNVYAVQFNPELDAEAINRQLVAYAEAGDFGVGGIDVLVDTGRNSGGNHRAGKLLRNFVEKFSN